MRKTRYIWLMICLTLLLPSCTASQTDSTEQPAQGPTWQEQYDLGVRYLAEGNYEEAIIAFTAAIEIDPKRAPAYVGRGDAYVKSGEMEENLAAALADYEKAVELDETSAEAYLGLADVYIFQENYEKAIEILSQGLEIIDDSKEILDSLERAKASYITRAVESKDYSAFYREENLMRPEDWKVNGKPIYECDLADFQAEFPCEEESASLWSEGHWEYRPQDANHRPSNLSAVKRGTDHAGLLVMLQWNRGSWSQYFQPDMKGIHLEDSFDETLKKSGMTELGIQYCRSAEKPFGITVSRKFIIHVDSGETASAMTISFNSIESHIYSHISFHFNKETLAVITGDFSYSPMEILF